ncbi:hypothetical protein [Companilactobacillus crustorum]|uniref:hypothetical protein n=1 Tax=Companilactobacillus crustorum TaxID=392416 RepID=UPI000957B357|nr:hypothetical protein [Companilactobacillus crustorum]APU71398.1 hypothetical protein BI355_1079 [Companilactobacillus crustorum]WDT66573.1 hypothetical protein NV391_05045 [Companilactobacillus crustorum]
MKLKLILSSITIVILLGGFAIHQTTDVNNRKTITKRQNIKKVLSKNDIERINNKFYSHKIEQQSAAIDFVNYPSTFSGLVNSGELTIEGKITGLESYVFENRPYTIAAVTINKVLHGDKSQLNKTIRVMFLGGNITRKEMLAAANYPSNSSDDSNSEEIVTVEEENNRLPKAGERLAMVLSKLPAGTNNIPGKFWSPAFAYKSVFFRNSNGEYKRIPEAKSIGGGFRGSTSTNQLNQEDDEKMNNGMNALINKDVLHKVR